MPKRWWLPEGMEEWLPPASWRAEMLRRELLDRYRGRGYELVLTPLLEHLDALLTGTGSDLEQQTFKLIDPAGGRLLGLRADITPQAARIAARRFPGRKTLRLCYAGTVLRTRPDSPGGARSPRQVGCELFGDGRIRADLEILELMLETLACAGVPNVHLDLGHAGVYRAIVARLGLEPDSEAALFDILQRKSAPDLAEFVAGHGLDRATGADLARLIELNGDAAVLETARAALAGAGEPVGVALDELAHVVKALRRQNARLPIHVDLAELRGYRYQTGIVFAAFAPGHGRELARGGRYDGVGHEFGVPRPATGFSADLNELLRLGQKKTFHAKRAKKAKK